MSIIESNLLQTKVNRWNYLRFYMIIILFTQFFSSISGAQDIVIDGTPDPPDTEYARGVRLMSLQTVNKLARKPVFRAYLPVRIDLSNDIPKPGSQGQLGSCTAWAVGYAARSYYTRTFENRALKLDNIPSPRYLYDAARSGGCDGGSTFEEVTNVLRNGALSLKAMPYSDECKAKISQKAANATDFKVDGLSRLFDRNSNEIRGQLAKGNPVLFSMRINRAFDRLRRHEVFRDRKLSFRDNNSEGWHALTAIGYDDVRQAALIINSWGRGWGNGGYAWISYDLIADDYWVREALVLDVARPPPLPGPIPTPPKPDPHPLPDTPRNDAAILAELKQIRCSKLNVRQESLKSVVSGFVGSTADRDRILAAVENSASLKIGTLTLAPWPACEVLETLAGPMEVSDGPKLNIKNKAAWLEGERFSFSVNAPTQFSYLYVTYLQADGTALHLVQPSADVFAQTPPRSTLVFGDGKEGRGQFEISSPFGSEVLVAIASRSPLFESSLPKSQSDREYLSVLRRALLYKPNQTMPDRIVSAAVVPILTKRGD